MTNVLVVGLGSIGNRHLGNILANKKKARIGDVFCCDSSEIKRQLVSKKYKVKTFSDVREALRLKPHATLITTPTGSHVKLGSLAASHGSSLFIEKPLSFKNDGEVKKLVGKMNGSKKLLVGCNLRFQPSVQLIKRLLSEKKIGRVIAVRAQSGHYLPDWRPSTDYRKSYSAQKDEGGVLLDCVQIFDILQWLFGQARELFCFLDHSSHLQIKSEDVAQVQIKFKSGVFAQVHVDYIQRYQEKTLHIIGEEGTIIWEWTSKKVRLFEAVTKKWREFPEPINFDFNQTYVDELLHFFDCIRNDLKPIQTPKDALAILEWIEAAKKSAKTQRSISL